MQEQVVAHGAHCGIALDGDADRLIMVDEHGVAIDGDQIMALIALSSAEAGRLAGGGIAGTVMSNLGLERFLGGLGLALGRAAVGDRYVLEMMRSRGYNVGGEQSGHIILSDYTTTGDGLVAALQVLAVLLQRGRPASEVCRVFAPLPQTLRNVRLKGGDPMATPAVQDAIRAAEATLARVGRLLVRKSGTEPVVRVMAEGEDEAIVTRVVDELVATIARAAG
jgi:phosphoglucosamine mutase